MVKTNPARRNHLLDAAIEVLAHQGAHGLTYRAVEDQAMVPPGTVSNYFRNRDELLRQTGRRARDRYRDQVHRQARATNAAGPAGMTAIAQATIRNALTENRSLYLAIFELRLECPRNPGLQELITDLLEANLDDDMRLHDPQIGCGRHEMTLLAHALTGILLIQLTTPDPHDPTAPDALVATLVERLTDPVPGTSAAPSTAPS